MKVISLGVLSLFIGIISCQYSLAVQDNLTSAPISRQSPFSDLLYSSNKKKIPNESLCFVINQIALEGDLAEQFQWVLSYANPEDDPALGRCLGTEGINLLMLRMDHALMHYGFITTRVLMAPQKIDEGKITFTISPGRIRAIRYAAGSQKLAINIPFIKPGDIFNVRTLDKVIEESFRYPTIDLKIHIYPVSGNYVRGGDSDLVLWVEKKEVEDTSASDI